MSPPHTITVNKGAWSYAADFAAPSRSGRHLGASGL